MTEPNDRGQGGDRYSAEGVRIIRAEEAQAALEAGAAAGRRPDDELRYGDVPPAPSGPRPAHRFPLPATVDPAAVPHPPVANPPAVNPRQGEEPPAPSRGADAPAGAVRDALSGTEDEPTEVVILPAVGAERSTAWEPPPVGEPLPSTAQIPVWDSPLDDAEGISPAPTSWTPPEAWATPSGMSASAGASSGDPSAPRQGSTPSGAGPGEAPGAGAGGLPGGTVFGATSDEAGAGPDPEVDPALPAGPESDFVHPASPNEGKTVTGGFGTDLPHWTDPPTGEVPRLRPEEPDADEADDLEAWKAVGQDTGVRWRGGANDWDDIGGVGELGSDETRVGALDTSRTEHSDLYSFDEDFERLDEERSSGPQRVFDDEYVPEEEPLDVPSDLPPPRVPSGARAAARGSRVRTSSSGDVGGGSEGGRDLGSAILVGIGLLVLLVIGYVIGSRGLVVLSAAVVLACSIEAFAMVQRRGFKPATLLGLAGAVGVVFGAYWRGTEALAIVTAVFFVATMLWYLIGVVEARPLANVSATLMIYLWVGFLGSFAALLLRAPHGKGLFLGPVLCTVAADVVAYAVGSQVGSRTLAPWISPGKTLEGVLGGGLAAIVVGAIVGSQVTPWGGVKHGLLLGLVVAILAPIGDLFESMIKRDLAVKDSGTVLPGHGGLLDRFDSILIVLPAAYYLATLFNLHT